MRSAKRFLASALCLLMLLALLPVGVSAAGSGVTITEETVSGEVKKLVFTATSPTNLTVASLNLSYDNAVIQPVTATAGNTDVTIADQSTDASAFGASYGTYPNLMTRVGAKWAVSDKRSAFSLTMISADPVNGVNIASGSVIAEFYYRVKPGQTPARGTFRLETTAYTDSLLPQLFADENEQRAMNLSFADSTELYVGYVGHEDTVSAPLTYTNCTVATPASIAISGAASVSIPAGGDAATEQYTAATTATDGLPMDDTYTWSIETPATHTGITINGNTLSVAAGASACAVTLKATSVTLGTVSQTKVVDVVRADSVVTSIALSDAPASTAVPTAGNTANVTAPTAAVKNQYGDTMPGQTVTWSMDAAAGITLNTATGAIEVTPSAAAGGYTITASCAGKTADYTLTLTKAAAAATSLTLASTTETRPVPTAGSAAVSVPLPAVTVYDQYGAEMAGQTIGWSITTESHTGVAISGANAQIDNTAAAGSYTFRATCGGTADFQLTLTRETLRVAGFTVKSGTLAAPVSENSTLTLEIENVKDQYGATIEAGTVTWSFSGTAPKGVTLTPAGVLTATVAAADNTYNNNSLTFDVQARAGEVVKTGTITLTRAAAVATEVVICTDSTLAAAAGETANVAIPVSGSKLYTYYAKVLDQYGLPMTAEVTWTVTGNDKITNSGSTVSVAYDAVKDSTATLKAAVNAHEDTLTLTAKAIEVDWTPVSVNNITYGATNADAVTLASASGTATVATGTVNGTVNGTFSIQSAEARPDAGDRTVTVAFTVTDGEYAGTYTKPYDVTVAQLTAQLSWSGDSGLVYNGSAKNVTALVTNTLSGDTCTVTVRDGAKTDAGSYVAEAIELSNDNYALPATATHAYTIAAKSLRVEWTGTSLTYNATEQAPSANVVTGVGVETLPLSVSGGQTAAGTHNATAAMTTPNSNYTLTNASTTYDIAAATVSISTSAPEKTLLANAAANTDAAALKSAMALPATVTISGAGTETSAAITWANAAQSYSRLGTTYTYVGTLDANRNYANRPTLTATLTVTPVTITSVTDIPATLTLAKNEVLEAETLAALGLPATVTLHYNNSVDDCAGVTPTWDKQLSDLTAAANRVSEGNEQQVTVALTAGCFDAWATAPAQLPTCVITITDKFPVAVSFTTPVDDITYGGTLAEPIATATVEGTPVDTFTYTYTGTTAAGLAYGPTETAPAAAGTYAVTATLDHSTHCGSKQDAFTISPKTVSLSWSGYSALVYDGKAKAVTAAAGDLETGDACEVLVNNGGQINVGDYIATATGLSNANYALPSGVTQAYSIAPAARALSAAKTYTILTTGRLTDTVVPSCSNLDNSAQFVFTSSDTNVATVSKNGLVTAVGNGPVTITVTLAATGNYEAASTDVTFTVWATPLTTATATSSVPTDKLTSGISGNTVRVSGAITDGATLTVSCAGAKAIDITLNTAEIKAGGKSNIITLAAGTTVTYTVDTTGMTIREPLVELKDAVKAAANALTGVIETLKTAVDDAMNAAATGAENLTAAAAKALQEAALKLKDGKLGEIAAAITGDYLLEVEPTLNITAKDIKTGDAPSLTLELHPTYSVLAKPNTEGGIPGTGENVTLATDANLPNTAIQADVNIAFALPDGLFSNLNAIYARHGSEILRVTVDNGIASWKQGGFSETTLFSDERTGTLAYTFADGSTRSLNYDPSLIGAALPTDSKSGFVFAGWTVNGTEYKTLTDELLGLLSAAPGKTVAVTAKFNTAPSAPVIGPSSTPAGSYVITVTAGKNGTISPETTELKAGESVTFTITADEGSRIEAVLVDGISVGVLSTYTFEAVDADHTISATFIKRQNVSDVFLDVTDALWCHDDIQYVYDRDLMNGVGNDLFAPNGTLTRGMWVTMLYRLAGSPTVSGTTPFTDLTADWYADAVLWASTNGITNGATATTFCPENPVTRQEIVQFLYRYAQYVHYDISAAAALTGYTDAGQVWATAAMQWAVALGIMRGASATTLNPNGNATRGEAAAFLARFIATVTE